MHTQGAVVKNQRTLVSLVVGRGDVKCLFDACIGEENWVCISEAYNSSVIRASKHVDVHYQFLADHVEKESGRLRCMQTAWMEADIIPKNLKKQKSSHLMKLSDVV